MAIAASEGEQEQMELIKIIPTIQVTILVVLILFNLDAVLDLMTQPPFFMFLTILQESR